jgi:GDP-L-fucose synthase
MLITGSNGMVGRNLLENENITKHDILKPSSSKLNLLNYNDTRNYLKDTKPDMIVHCAGKVGGIQANSRDLYGFFTDNAVMGINIVKAAKEEGIKRLLNLSSSCVYPMNCKNPLKEEYILTSELEPPNEGYALAKLSVQKMCEYISREYSGYLYKTLIPCNLYGRWDKFDDDNSHMIPAVMNLPALKGGVSCKRCPIDEVRSVRKLFNCGVYYHFLLALPNSTALKAQTKFAMGIRPHCE